jgi:hypothetical protein
MNFNEIFSPWIIESADDDEGAECEALEKFNNILLSNNLYYFVAI